MSNDTELLRRYVEERSEGPFTALVREHLNLVYSAARREMNGDTVLAQDISQAVFTEFARHAPRLLSHPSLAGWLYTTVRRKAANLRRAEHQRRRREKEAHMRHQMLSEDSPDQAWQQLRPVLDDALHELKEADREVVILRFLEERPLREVGVRLGLTENATRMRVDRALEKLRARLARRGITSTTSGLATAMAVGALTPAPAALAATIAASALVSGAAVGSTTFTLIQLITMTKIKLSLIGALTVAAVAVPTWQQIRLQRLLTENAQLRVQQTEQPGLRHEGQRGPAASPDGAELERLRQYQAQTQSELLRLRGMAGLARRANAEAEQLRAQLAQQAKLGTPTAVSAAEADVIDRAMEQQVESQLTRMAASLHLDPAQAQDAREILMRKARLMSTSAQQFHSGKFDKQEVLRRGKEAGNTDAQVTALLTPKQLELYQGYKQDENARLARQAANGELVSLQPNLDDLTPEQQDRAFVALYENSLNQLTGTLKSEATSPADSLQWEFDQKAKALESVLTPTQMEQYQKQLAFRSKLMRDLMQKFHGNTGSK